MKSWFKFFGLGFFSNKITREANTRGVLNCVLAFLLSCIFIYCGVLASNTVPFYTHYDSASDFKELVYAAVGKTQLTVSEDRVFSDSVINTFVDGGEDGHGYNLVVDTRPSDALDDFEAYCLFKDGKTEIPYEEYLGLSEDMQSNYTFAIRYTPNVLVLTDEKIEGFKSYLETVEDEGIKKQYSELDASAEGYKNNVYALYVTAYYPQITAYERAGAVPLLRSYYYREYLYSSETEKSLFIFEDVLFGYFQTDGGVEISFYGSYGKVDGGAVTTDKADSFIKSAFASSAGISANVYLLNVIKYIPFVVLIAVALAFLSKIVLKVFKDEDLSEFNICVRIQFAYLTVTSLIAALILFICGFFVSSGVLNGLMLPVVGGILAARTLLLLVGEYIFIKKNKKVVEEEATE